MTAAEPVVLAFGNLPYDGMREHPSGCAAPARFTVDPADRASADAVVFHLPALHPDDLAAVPRSPGQLWVAWSLESRVTCPLLDDPEVMARFDLTMTYERASDVWHPYLDRRELPELRRPPAASHEASPVAWLQSNADDRAGRSAFVAALMRRVRIDSYGRVMRTRAEVVPPGAAARLALYRRYKFVLALENSIAPDYVSEKVYEVLRAGAVPVYRGCPEVAELLPTPDCYIDADAFASPAELGDHLDHLDRDDAAYRALHRWRDGPFQPSFQALATLVEEPALCRLAAAVRDRRGDSPRPR